MPTQNTLIELAQAAAEQAGWDIGSLTQSLIECQTDMLLLRQQMAAIQLALDECRSDWGPGDYATVIQGGGGGDDAPYRGPAGQPGWGGGDDAPIRGYRPSQPALQAIFGRTMRGRRR